MKLKKLGLIINPVAGLGGSVGLNGTDGLVAEALRRGAQPQAEHRAQTALMELQSLRDTLMIYTGPGALGGHVAQEMGFSCQVQDGVSDEQTSAQTTQDLLRWLQRQGVDLILFTGGDGTARDICTLTAEGDVFLGIPAGVKIHSPVYARSASAAGKLAGLFLTGKVREICEQEVLDIDEVQYRNELINTKLFGYLPIPMEKHYTQNRKCGSPPSEAASMESIAAWVIDHMEDDVYYIIGAGTTTRAIMRQLGLPNTLIGVDIIQNRRLVAKDVYGQTILQYIRGQRAKLVLTITGGQGFLLGRGNQQLTPEVIREIKRENLLILATREKICSLRGQPLLVDTGDAALDQALCGYYRIITSYYETTISRVERS